MLPTWSSMAYGGGIHFLDHSFGRLDVFEDLQLDEHSFDGQSLTTTVWEFVDLDTRLNPRDKMCHELLNSGGPKGWVNLNEDTEVPTERNIVVLAKHTKLGRMTDYYVLLVGSIGPQGNKYRRLGMGGIRKECKLKDKGIGYII